MKRFLVYVTVLISVLFVGLTTYYFLRSDEYIGYVNAADNYQTFYLNKGDEMPLPIVHTKPDPETTITVLSSRTTVATYQEPTEEEEGKIIAVGGGLTTITITTTNDNFGPFVFSVQVGDGTKTNPWIIDSETDLKHVGIGQYQLGDSYKVVSNITLNNEFTPIGLVEGENGEKEVKEFSGVFDGGLKTVAGLTVKTTDDTAGLFASVAANATIKNVKLDIVEINGENLFAGAIAAKNRGEIYKCSVTNAVVKSSKPGATVGGLVGQMSYAEGDTADKALVTMCSFAGMVSQTEAEVNGPVTLGGLIGKVLGGTVTNNYAVSEMTVINTESTVGALIGSIDSVVINEQSKYATVIHNYALLNSDVQVAKRGFIGAIPETALEPNEAEIKRIRENLYYVQYTGEETTQAGMIRVETKDEMQGDIALYEAQNWNITTIEGTTDVWYIGELYPTLNVDASIEVFNVIVYNYNDLLSTDKIIQIGEDTRDPEKKAEALAGDYQLVATEENNGVFDLGGIVWTPIGTEEEPFVGTFNGNGCTIKNFKINTLSAASDGLGFFGVVEGTQAVIQNIVFEDVTIIADAEDFAGTVVGVNFGANVKDCVVKNVTIKNAYSAGFIAGYNDGLITTTQKNADETYKYSVLESTVDGACNKIYSDEEKAYVYGGIVGMNFGVVQNARVQGYFEIIGKTTSNSAIAKVIGGIAAMNVNGKIAGSSIESGKLSDKSVSVMIAGIVPINGSNDQKGVVEYSHVGNDVLSTTMESVATGTKKTMIGGLVVQNIAGSVVKKSFARVTVDSAYYVGGIATLNNGTIDQTYVKGSLKGEFVGGLAVGNTGTITNSYTFATLDGVSDNSYLAGIAIYVSDPGIVDKCFISVSYSTVGQTDIETYTNIQGTMANAIISIFNKNYKLGKIENVLINTTAAGRAYDEATTFGKDLIKSVTYKTENECKANMEALVTSLHLDGVWTAEEGKFLRLTHLDLDGIAQHSDN